MISSGLCLDLIGFAACIGFLAGFQVSEILFRREQSRRLRFDGTLVELPLDKPKVRVLQDGDY